MGPVRKGRVRKGRACESVFAKSLYFASGAFARAMEKVAAECWKLSGLTPSQGNLLLHVIDNTHAFPVFISSDLRVNPSSVTRLVDQLVAKGLIKRMTYHRRCYLEVTNKTVELLPVLAECNDSFLAKCNDVLGKEVSRILARSLNRATDKLTASKIAENTQQLHS